MHLRGYQQAAVDSVYRYLRERDDNPVVVIPTGGGKTPVIATICQDAVTRWQGRVLVIAHVKELLEQAVGKLRHVCPDLDVGVYSAGLNRRDTEQSVVVAGIQSIYQRACDLGGFDLILIDEAHTLPPDGDGMYRQLLQDAHVINPHVRVIGLTATPYRLKSGTICGPEYFLNEICYEIGVKELIRDGFLSPLVSKNGTAKFDTDGLHVRAGEFVAGEAETLMDQAELVDAACHEIVERTQDRNAVLIFAAGVEHGRHVQRVLQEQHGVECGFICGETPPNERAELLARFRGNLQDGLFTRQPLKYLCNVNVLTTGFDSTNIDCVVLLRPTMSPGLYYQMVGRGFRLHPGKQNCLILDYGGNVLRHGPVDQLKIKEKSHESAGVAPAKECPECQSLIAAGYAVCPDCGFEFPPPETTKHAAVASSTGVLSGEVTTLEYEVRDILYQVHRKRDAPEDSPRTMRVDYRLGLDHWQSEWICFEHSGWARRQAERWWKRRSPDPVPETSQLAVDIANAGGLAKVDAITVRSVAGEKFDRIVGCKIGPLPEPAQTLGGVSFADEDIPF